MIAPVMEKAREYGVFTYLVIVLILYAFLVMRVGILAGTNPSQGAVQERLEVTRRPQINEDAALKLQQLEQNSAEVHALFNEARNNPFQE